MVMATLTLQRCYPGARTWRLPNPILAKDLQRPKCRSAGGADEIPVPPGSRFGRASGHVEGETDSLTEKLQATLWPRLEEQTGAMRMAPTQAPTLQHVPPTSPTFLPQVEGGTGLASVPTALGNRKLAQGETNLSDAPPLATASLQTEEASRPLPGRDGVALAMLEPGRESVTPALWESGHDMPDVQLHGPFPLDPRANLGSVALNISRVPRLGPQLVRAEGSLEAPSGVPMAGQGLTQRGPQPAEAPSLHPTWMWAVSAAGITAGLSLAVLSLTESRMKRLCR